MALSGRPSNQGPGVCRVLLFLGLAGLGVPGLKFGNFNLPNGRPAFYGLGFRV